MFIPTTRSYAESAAALTIAEKHSSDYGWNMVDELTDPRRKRLLYRANYRGFKEADILLGGFAKASIHDLSDVEIEQFEQLLMAKDHDIYDWYTGAQKLPKAFDTPLFARLKAYKSSL